MYTYDNTTLGYSDNLSISSTETAAHPHLLSEQTPVSVAASHLLKMNSAFMPDDAARLGAGYAASVDPANSLLLDQQPPQPPAQHQLGQVTRFSSGSESRTQTPSAKRSREDEESEAGESEGNAREQSEVVVAGKRSGRRKIKIEYIEDKSRRHITFSKRKAGIMKKAYELSTLTGTQVLLLVVSETGLVYTFTTPKLQPIVTQAEGKNLIQACLSVPDQPGDRVPQPIPTESNSYMSQPRHHHSAAAAAAAAAVSVLGAHDGSAAHSASLMDDRKPNSGSPAAGIDHAAPYLQYPYGQSAMAQAVAAASAGTPGAYTPNMMPQNAAAAAAAAAANGSMQYAAVPGYTSYPGSNSQSQHHSPIAAAASHSAQTGNGMSAAAAVAAASMPGINSLASYHHGYSAPQQNHYSYHQQNHFQQPYHQQNHSQEPDQPVGSNSSVSAALAVAVAAAGSQQSHGAMHANHAGANGMPAVSYMSNHYWQPQGMASPQPQPPQSAQSAQQPANLIQRTSYAGN
ncbi:transcription factor of the MADS box [Coemansia sp. RSA 1199]|nr:transcription factor of the MADS box [Coemansia sp. RSA 1199]